MIDSPDKKAQKRRRLLEKLGGISTDVSVASEPAPVEPVDTAPSTPPSERSQSIAPNPDSQRQRERTRLKDALARYESGRDVSASGTALYRGMENVRDIGSLGVELGKQIENMKANIDVRIVRMFSIMDEAAGRALNGDAYEFDTTTEEIRALEDVNFADQLKATMQTAADFAKIVEALPQEIASLDTELHDAERAFSAVLLREPIPASTPLPVIDPWNPATAPRNPSSASVTFSAPEIPNEPAFEHGAHETVRALNLASGMIGALQELKRRIDAQTINILNTVNEAATRGLNGEAYSDSDDGIAAVMDDPNPINRLETTVRTAHDLVAIMHRLPQEIGTLIAEIRDAEQQFLGVLQDNPRRS
jgi:hypothetical protein